MVYPQLPYIWTLDGVVFGFGSGAYLTEVSGWFGKPSPRLNKRDRTGDDGVYLGGQYVGPRVVSVKGCWFNANANDRDFARSTLARLCSSGGRFGSYSLTRAEGSRTRRADVVLDDQIDIRVRRDNLTVEFETQFIAADPRLWSLNQVVWDPIGLATDAVGGVLWNGSPPATGGTEWNGAASAGLLWQTGASGSGGQVTPTNNGDADTPVVFTVTATGGTGLLNPFVRNMITNEVVQYNGTLAVGNYFTVDTGTGRVTVNGSPSSGALSRAELFDFSPGLNRVEFGSALGTDQGLLTGYHYDAFLGG
jgi:hypothetical protein